MNRNLVSTLRRTAALLALSGLLAAPAQAQTALPGTVQAETYSSMSGVVIEPTTDTGGGSDVGYIDTGDWACRSDRTAWCCSAGSMRARRWWK